MPGKVIHEPASSAALFTRLQRPLLLRAGLGGGGAAARGASLASGATSLMPTDTVLMLLSMLGAGKASHGSALPAAPDELSAAEASPLSPPFCHLKPCFACSSRALFPCLLLLQELLLLCSSRFRIVLPAPAAAAAPRSKAMVVKRSAAAQVNAFLLRVFIVKGS